MSQPARISGLLERSGYIVRPRPPSAATRPASAPALPRQRWVARHAIHLARGAALLSATVFDRFGITAGASAIDAALLALYLFIAVGLAFDVLALSPTRLALYAAVVASAVASFWLNRFVGASSSLPSLLLLFVIYAPFVFSLRPGVDGGSDARAAASQFLGIALFCAIAGIAQFYLQFVIHARWLFDYTDLIPPVFRCTPGHNTVIPAGSFLKSNGFFFREPSGFSFTMALAFIVEWSLERRPFRLACFLMALLLSYSGTGLLTLALSLLVPFNGKVLVRLLAAAAIAGVLVLVLGDVMNLSFTLGRVHEFTSERSSAYIRYIAPGRLLYDTFADAPWTPFFGHGPGMISRVVLDYEFHDPTWAKLLFEYGIVGFVAVCGLYIVVLRRPAAPLRWRVVLFVTWLVTGGNLLSAPENVTRLCLVGFLPALASPLPVSPRKARAFGKSSYLRDAA